MSRHADRVLPMPVFHTGFFANEQRFEHNSQGNLLTFYKLVSTPPPWRRREIFYVDDTETAFGACRLKMI